MVRDGAKFWEINSEFWMNLIFIGKEENGGSYDSMNFIGARDVFWKFFGKLNFSVVTSII